MPSTCGGAGGKGAASREDCVTQTDLPRTLPLSAAQLAVSADSPNANMGAATIKGCQTTGSLPPLPLALAT